MAIAPFAAMSHIHRRLFENYHSQLLTKEISISERRKADAADDQIAGTSSRDSRLSLSASTFPALFWATYLIAILIYRGSKLPRTFVIVSSSIFAV